MFVKQRSEFISSSQNGRCKDEGLTVAGPWKDVVTMPSLGIEVGGPLVVYVVNGTEDTRVPRLSLSLMLLASCCTFVIVATMFPPALVRS